MTAIIKNNIYIYIILFLLSNSVLFSNPTYKMTLEDIQISSLSKLEASVYIENIGEELQLTSYQCALSINQDLDLSSLVLSYVEGSSELLNEPNLYVGIDNIDGPSELTFVSYIGNDIISKKTLIGRFTLEGNIDISKVNLLGIHWDFEGTISTIITGKDFANITNPASHESIFPKEEKEELDIAKVEVTSSEASAVYSSEYTNEMLFDGITSQTDNGATEGRWAVDGFPQWVTIDLGEETYVDRIALDPFGSEDGITYDCEFYSGTNDNKTLISTATTGTGSQWSSHSLGGVRARYITMVVTGSEGNTWTDFWEMEVFGNNSTTGVGEEVEDEDLAEEATIPSEYGISQNYPNPFNPSTKVEVRMKESGSARLEVYNLIGERVLAVLDQELSAGVHEVNIDGSLLASGVYIYKLDVDNQFSQIKKMNLLK